MSGVNISQSFNQQGVYPCPACRLGRIQALSLMDVMACNTCPHIFMPNLERQLLSTIDGSPPLVWHWNGRNWIGAHGKDVNLDWSYWLIAAAFVGFPPTLVGFSTYVWMRHSGHYPPLLPFIWMGLTFFLHLFLVGLSIIGFYRFSIGTYFRILGRTVWRR
jgi:hypothetical protein